MIFLRKSNTSKILFQFYLFTFRRYDFKKNETTRKEIEEYKKNVIDFDKGVHWNYGTDKVKLSTSSSTLTYDNARARFANLSLGENALKSIKCTSQLYGFHNNDFKSSMTNSYKPVDLSGKIGIYGDSKKTNIQFNPVKQQIEKTTIYKSDFLNRDE